MILNSCLLVVFKNQLCVDCGATGDARLMPKYCHMEPIYIHPGNIVQYHPKGILSNVDCYTLLAGVLFRSIDITNIFI